MPIEKIQTNRKEESKVRINRTEMIDNIENSIFDFTSELFKKYGKDNIELPAPEAAELKEIISALRKEEFSIFREELQKTYFFEKIFSIDEGGYVETSKDEINADLYKFRVRNICGEDDYEMVEAAKVLNSYASNPVGSHILDFKKGMLPIAKELYLEAKNAEIHDEEFNRAKKIIREWLLLRDKGFGEKEKQNREKETAAETRANLKIMEAFVSRPRTKEDIQKELVGLYEEKEEAWQRFIGEGFEDAEKNSFYFEILENLISDFEEEIELLPARQKMEKMAKRQRTEEERDSIYKAHGFLLKAKQIRDNVSRKMSDSNFEKLYKIAEQMDETDEENIHGIKDGRIRYFLNELLKAKKLEEESQEEFFTVYKDRDYFENSKNKTNNKREVK